MDIGWRNRGKSMSQHIKGISREQMALLPVAVEDYVGEHRGRL